MIYVRVEFVDSQSSYRSFREAYRDTFDKIYDFINQSLELSSEDKKLSKVYITNLGK